MLTTDRMRMAAAEFFFLGDSGVSGQLHAAAVLRQSLNMMRLQMGSNLLRRHDNSTEIFLTAGKRIWFLNWKRVKNVEVGLHVVVGGNRCGILVWLGQEGVCTVVVSQYCQSQIASQVALILRSVERRWNCLGGCSLGPLGITAHNYSTLKAHDEHYFSLVVYSKTPCLRRQEKTRNW